MELNQQILICWFNSVQTSYGKTREQIYVRGKPRLAVKKMFAENASITGLSKVWSSLSCSNYPGYHSCGWKMKCFINLTHSCHLRPTAVMSGSSCALSSAIENFLLHLPVERISRLCILVSVHGITNKWNSTFLLLVFIHGSSFSCQQSSKVEENL